MRTITHRELRNSSAEILRAVAEGETLQVTNHGRVVAVISPPGRTALERLREEGKVRAATSPPSSLAAITPRRLRESTADIVADLRGDR